MLQSQLLVLAVALVVVMAQVPPTIIKPKRLTADRSSTIALFSPASPYSQEVPYDPSLYVGYITGNLTSLYNTSITYASHMNEVWAYLAGFDADRAGDVTAQFANPNVQAMISNRGGVGCTRIIDSVDYSVIANNPKIFQGYSDLTAFLLSIHFRTGLVTFHGPMGIDAWTDPITGAPTMNADSVTRILFNNEMALWRNPPSNETTTIVSGKARGKLVGGNLSLFVAVLGTPWFPTDQIKWEDYILFLEDVGEEPYHIDRMITTIHLSGILSRVAGVVWGTCTGCTASSPTESFTIPEVLQQKFGGLSVPVFSGLLFGHNGQQFIMPIGIEAEIDADAGTIQLLEPALSD